MPATVQKAVWQQVLNGGEWFLRNASIRHGHPKDAQHIELLDEPLPTAQAVSPTPAVVPTAPQSSPAASLLKTAGLVGLSLAAGGGMGGLALSAVNALTTKTPIVQQFEGKTPQTLSPKEKSPLEWALEQGLNVEPSK